MEEVKSILSKCGKSSLNFLPKKKLFIIVSLKSDYFIEIGGKSNAQELPQASQRVSHQVLGDR